MLTIWYLILLLFTLYLTQLALGPIVIYFASKQTANPQFRTFDLSNPPIPLPTNYTQSLPLLESLGFTPVAHLVSASFVNGAHLVLTVCVNRREKVTAIVSHILAEAPLMSRALLTFTEFCTEFEDGHEINTLNSDQAPVFVQIPEKQTFRLPHLKDPRPLYKVHQALTGQRIGASKRLAPPGMEIVELIDGMKRDLEREAGFGRTALDASGKWYRPTLKGAVYGTFMLIWPMGTVRRFLLRRRGVQLAETLLREV
jgi:hypothetical protein